MTTLFIHSGAFKTGSSSIELFLARNATLLAEHGLVYPKAGRGQRVQHSNLTAELKGWKAFSADVGGWSDVIDDPAVSDGANPVVSSELLSSLLPDELHRLGRLVSDTGVEVVWIHYVREQASLINAFYVERIITLRPEFAHLIERPFDEFPQWSPISLGFLDYDSFARNVMDAIPGVKLIVRPFVRSELDEGDVVADFCSQIGVVRSEGQTARTNVGAGWRTVEFAKRLTKLVAASPIAQVHRDQPNTIADRLRRIAGVRTHLMQTTNELGWNKESAVYATDAFRRTTQEHYRASNRRLGRMIGVDLAALFELERPRPHNAGNLDDISATEVLHVVERVLPSLFE